MVTLCPVAGKPGKRVSPVTLRNLIRDERLPEVEGREWFYCDLPDCDVVYFAADGRSLLTDALKVRVGVKEKSPPHTVCYCFGHTVESIRKEVERSGQSSVVASIAAKVKAGECSCETMNPKGSCCLGRSTRPSRKPSRRADRSDLTPHRPARWKKSASTAAVRCRRNCHQPQQRTRQRSAPDSWRLARRCFRR